MTTVTLLRRSLRYYWRTNIAVVAGVAIAVGVLAGALMVGASVRASLRDLALQRLGRTDRAVVAQSFFREELGGAFGKAAPLVALEGLVSAQGSGRRSSRVQLYGVDERFWTFHDIQTPTLDRNSALISEPLAGDLAARAGDAVVVRLENATAIPSESLHGRKDDVGRTVRLTVTDVLPGDRLGEFSLMPQQGSVRAIFMPLERLQALVDQPDRVNTILIAGGDEQAATRTLRSAVRLEDLGLRVRALPEHGALAIDSRSTILSDTSAAAATTAADAAEMTVVPTFTYLANGIRVGDRDIPYSTITAIDFGVLGWQRPEMAGEHPEAIVLNDWAARELQAKKGDTVTVEYYVWEPEGRLVTRSAAFRLAAIVPIAGVAADRDLVPEYPGITDSDRVADWDPPFPIDLKRVRPADELYWERYRATPKAFIPIERGQQLWSSRYGGLTALRVIPAPQAPLDEARRAYETALRAGLDPLSMGFAVYDVRAQNLSAAAGATDFGEYFSYFSTFLVVSALLLAASFFKLGVEQRLQEIGLLQALGMDPPMVRRLFTGEALALSIAGGIAGIAAAIGYAWVIMFGLRTWWIGAVGTTALQLHVDPVSLAAGAIGVVMIAVASIWWSLHALSRASARALIKGQDPSQGTHRSRRALWVSVIGGVVAVLFLTLAAAGAIPRAPGFFGAGGLGLVAALSGALAWLRRGRWGTLRGHGLGAIVRLGWRNTAFRPARSVVCIALIAFATFVIVAVEAFKRGDEHDAGDRRSGTGGYPLLMETLLPVVHDLNDPAGRDAMNLPAAGELQPVRFDRFRVRPGDDTSCLNLYQPKNPRILGVTADFINHGRFAFHSSLASSDQERANPWLLLTGQSAGGAIPVIVDVNSMTYVLHRKLGDVIELPGEGAEPTRLRIVAALADSIFQGELLMAEQPFVRAFPEWDGYRYFLVDGAAGQAEDVTRVLETALEDFGADVTSTAGRLAGYHRVEYTYLSTFQMLGGLGLVLGTLGLGAILLRNVLERRRELAVLRALGYSRGDFFVMVIAENALLLVAGLGIGTVCALMAIAPVWIERGSRLPLATIALLLLGVLGTGLLASIAATIAALRASLLPALRTE